MKVGGHDMEGRTISSKIVIARTEEFTDPTHLVPLDAPIVLCIPFVLCVKVMGKNLFVSYLQMLLSIAKHSFSVATILWFTVDIPGFFSCDYCYQVIQYT